MSLPLPGPLVELVPFFIDWKKSEHPTTALPSVCELISFKATHPAPARVASILTQLEIDLEIEKGPTIALIATINTPNGLQTIS